MSSKSIHTNPYIIHGIYIHNTNMNSVFVFCMYWLVCSYLLVYCLYIQAQNIQINQKYIQIHTNTCNTSNTTGQKPVVVNPPPQYKQIQGTTYTIHAKNMQIYTNTRGLTTTGFCPVMSVLRLYWPVFTCIFLVLSKQIRTNTINTC